MKFKIVSHNNLVGKDPFCGANATLEQIKLFVDLIYLYAERKLKYAIQLAKGEIIEVSETDIEQINLDKIVDLSKYNS